MTHLRYSKTTWRERESKERAKEERKDGDGCLHERVCEFLSARRASQCVCVRARVCAPSCLCFALTEDGADAAAGCAYPSTCLKQEGIFPSLFQISQAVQMGTDMFPK